VTIAEIVPIRRSQLDSSEKRRLGGLAERERHEEQQHGQQHIGQAMRPSNGERRTSVEARPQVGDPDGEARAAGPKPASARDARRQMTERRSRAVRLPRR
jgi:hypothetical protein